MNQEQKDTLKKHLSDLEQENGRLTPEDVVASAKKKDSPLHSFFEWDIKKAAYAHWLAQARELITTVMVVTKTETTSIKSVYYVRDPRCAGGEQGYISTDKLRTNEDLARDVLIAEFSRAGAALVRARTMAKVLSLEAEVENLITGIDTLRSTITVAAVQ